MKKKAKLDNWKILKDNLKGTVYGNPKFRDGTTIYTSKLIFIDFLKKEAETLNTIYKLLKEDET